MGDDFEKYVETSSRSFRKSNRFSLYFASPYRSPSCLMPHRAHIPGTLRAKACVMLLCPSIGFIPVLTIRRAPSLLHSSFNLDKLTLDSIQSRLKNDLLCDKFHKTLIFSSPSLCSLNDYLDQSSNFCLVAHNLSIAQRDQFICSSRTNLFKSI
jgi:hypothetical protein